MPFTGEHAARQAAPGRFTSYRRGHPDGWPEGVDAIWGIKPSGGTDIQSVRFKADKWTAEEAKDWLKRGGFITSSLEPAKAAPAVEKDATFQVEKVHPEQRLVFGWLYVSKTKDGTQVVDHSGETIQPSVLEKAAYEWALNSRKAGDMHQRVDGIGRMVSSVVFTKDVQAAMGIPPNTVPEGWWVGFYMDDDAAWDAAKTGVKKMFSIGGKAIRRMLQGENS